MGQPVLKVLLVDEDKHFAAELRSALPAYGYELELAQDAPRGLAKALRGGYCALILNAILSGFDGFSLMETLRRQSSVPVILMCPPMPEAVGGGRAPDAYLPKPFGAGELVEALRRLNADQART